MALNNSNGYSVSNVAPPVSPTIVDRVYALEEHQRVSTERIDTLEKAINSMLQQLGIGV